MIEDLRRLPRVAVCCRVVVSDRYGVWSAVTDDLSARGCQIVTARLLRVGTVVQATLSSDLFPEELSADARIAWSTPDRIGLEFLDPPGGFQALSPAEWLDKVLEHGELPDSTSTSRLVPCVRRSGARAPLTTAARGGRLVRTVSSGEGQPSRIPANGG
jgi:hypothetical protein